ncbi:MAG: Ig-like domain-containing protein, partial [Micromonosporaceae bacterium]
MNYTSGSGTSTLTFNYTVGAGETSADLDYASTAALALNGGTIGDAAGNPATLTLPAPGAANSLGANKAIVIDTTSPVVSIARINGAVPTFPYWTNSNVTSIGGDCGQLSGDLATVAVAINGSPASPATATCSSGAWTLTLSTPVSAEASHSVVATQTDTAGNTGTSAARTVIIDRTAPTVTITCIPNGKSGSGTCSGAAANGTGDSPNVTLTITLN